MPNVGILMSIYNETIEEISRSIDSMLKQTYRDFLFVIVLDNPMRNDVKQLIHDYGTFDKRIKFLVNEKNIGLAMSLNKARQSIDCPYLCRMDADDFSYPNRIEENLKYIKQFNADLVFSQFYFVDEHDKVIGREDDYYDSKDINKILNVINIIHHPTVFMKTEIFDKVNGYRNFPCAQDYDLWLRMSEVGCNFYMIEEKLVRYTMRESSVGNSMAFKQIATLNYIKKLRNMRIKNGYDNFSVENLNKYYIKNKVSLNQKKSLKVRNDLKQAQNYLNSKKYIRVLFIKVKIFIKYGVYRKHFINKMVDKFRLLIFFKINK